MIYQLTWHTNRALIETKIVSSVFNSSEHMCFFFRMNLKVMKVCLQIYSWLEVNITILYQKPSIFIEHLNHIRIKRLVNIQYPLEPWQFFSVMKKITTTKTRALFGRSVCVCMSFVVMASAICIHFSVIWVVRLANRNYCD